MVPAMCCFLSFSPHGNTGTCFSPVFSGSPEQQVHVLHSLSGCSFYHIIDRTHHDYTFGARIQLKGYICEIAALYPAGFRRKSRLQNADKIFILIVFIVDGLYFSVVASFTRDAYAVTRMPRFIGTRCGVKLMVTGFPAA